MRPGLPLILHGSLYDVSTACHRAAAAWAEQLERDGELRPLELAELEPGSVVWLDQGGANVKLADPLWRAHLVGTLGFELWKAAAPEAQASVDALIVRLEAEWPWWSWLRAINQERPNSISVVAARIERLVAQWRVLDQVGYVVLGRRRLTLEELLRQLYAHILDMWAPPPGVGPPRPFAEQLNAAAAAMVRASDRDRVERLAARLRWHVQGVPRARDATAGWDDEAFVRVIEGLEPDELEDVSSGYARGLLGIAYSLAR